MKSQRGSWALLVATVLVMLLSCADLNAQFIFYQPRGPMLNPPLVQPLQLFTWHYTYPIYNPYAPAYPTYNILPAPFLTARYGWDLSRDTYAAPTYGTGIRRTTADFGYARDVFNAPVRMRATLYPAIPFQSSRVDERLRDVRRARFEITVPDADAIVFFDGVQTKQSGMERAYITPELEENRLYTSTIEVRSMDGGSKAQVTRKRTFTYIAGETLRHQFTD